MLSLDENQDFKISGVPEEAIITGVIGDGSCFLHATVTSINQDYMTLSEDVRSDYIKRTREHLSENLDIESWKRLSNGSLAILTVITCLIEKLERNSKKITTLYGDSVQNFIKKHIQDAENNMKISREESYLDIEKLLINIPENLKKIVKQLAESCVQESFEDYKRNLGRVSYYIDDYYIEYLSKVFNVNVIFIKSDGTQYVISKSVCEEMLRNDDNKMFIILHYIDSTHYESIGIRRGGEVVRVFELEDPVIQRILRTCVSSSPVPAPTSTSSDDLMKEYIINFIKVQGVKIDEKALSMLIDMFKMIEKRLQRLDVLEKEEILQYYVQTVKEIMSLKDKKPKQPFIKVYTLVNPEVMEFAVNDILELLSNDARDQEENKGVIVDKTIYRFLKLNDEYRVLINL